MNPCLCLNSGINRGQLQVFLIIFISLPGLRCWQCSLPSCPHMSSFCLGHFVFPVKSYSQNKYCASWRALGLSCQRALPATAMHPISLWILEKQAEVSTAQPGCTCKAFHSPWPRLGVGQWQEVCLPQPILQLHSLVMTDWSLDWLWCYHHGWGFPSPSLPHHFRTYLFES